MKVLLLMSFFITSVCYGNNLKCKSYFTEVMYNFKELTTIYSETSIFNLLQRPRFQEELWKLELSNSPLAYEIRKQAESFLLSAAVTKEDSEYLNPKNWEHKNPASSPEVWTLENSIKTVYKRHYPFQSSNGFVDNFFGIQNNAIHEAASYELDKAINFQMVPITVLRSSLWYRGSLQLFIQNVSAGDGSIDIDEFHKMIIFNYMTDETDRFIFSYYNTNDEYIGSASHSESDWSLSHKNVLVVRDNGKIITIDSGGAFSYPKQKRLKGHDRNSVFYTYQDIYHANKKFFSENVKELVRNINESNVREAVRPYLPDSAIQRLISRIQELKRDLK